MPRLNTMQMPLFLAMASIKGVDKDVEFTRFVDPDSGCTFIARANTAYSPDSGEQAEKATDAPLASSPAEEIENDLVQVAHCAACESRIMTTASSAMDLYTENQDQPFACVACGSPLEIDIDADKLLALAGMEEDDQDSADTDQEEVNDEDQDSDNDESTEDQDSEDIETTDEDETSEEDQDSEETDQESDNENVSDSDTEMTDEEENDSDAENEDTAEFDPSDFDTDDIETTDEDETSEEDQEESADDDEVTEDEAVDEEENLSDDENVDTASILAGAPITIIAAALDREVDWKNAGVDVVLSSIAEPTMFVFANGEPVGKLTKNAAHPDITEMFGTAAYVKGFTAVAKGHEPGTKEHFGYSTMLAPMAISSEVKHLVDTASVDANNAVDARVKEKIDSLKQSMSIVALASAKGLWPEISNPVAEQLITDLAQNGIHNPEEIVNSAYAKQGFKYIETLLASALDLSDQSVEVRNAKGQMVKDAVFAGAVKGIDTLAKRLEAGSIGVTNVSAPQIAVPHVDTASMGGKSDSNISIFRRALQRS